MPGLSAVARVLQFLWWLLVCSSWALHCCANLELNVWPVNILYLHSDSLQFISCMSILQPVFVDSHRIYVPVLVKGDGLLQGDQCLRVVIWSGLKYQEQVIYLLCVWAHIWVYLMIDDCLIYSGDSHCCKQVNNCIMAVHSIFCC